MYNTQSENLALCFKKYLPLPQTENSRGGMKQQTGKYGKLGWDFVWLVLVQQASMYLGSANDQEVQPFSLTDRPKRGKRKQKEKFVTKEATWDNIILFLQSTSHKSSIASARTGLFG